MKKYFKSFIKEIIPVIIGILIALFINNWNEDRKERKYFNEILNSIERELEETQKDVEAKLILQHTLVDTINFYLEDETISLNKIMNKTNGISIPTIRIHSWLALSNSNIQLLNYDDLSSLANLEEEKALLREKSKYLMNFLYNNISKKTRLKKSMLIGLIFELISTENSILSEIKELNERIKTRN